MEITVNVNWVSGVASWQPVTKLVGRNGLPALLNVAVWVGDNTVTAMVTDRYRMVYSVVDEVDGAVAREDDKPYLIPMDVFTRFVTATKHLRGIHPVTVTFDEDEVTFADNLGVRIVSPVAAGQYPNTRSLVERWQPAETIVNDMRWNMKLLADVTKFANPAVGALTAAKRQDGWNVTAGDPELRSSFRFDQGAPETFAVYVMPMSKDNVR